MRTFLLCCALIMAAPMPMATVGCTTAERVREDALAPTMVRTMGEVRRKALRGVGTLPAIQQETATNMVNEFFGIIQTQDVGRIRGEAAVMWPQVKELAELGIQDMVAKGEVVEGVAASMFNTVQQFNEAMLQI